MFLEKKVGKMDTKDILREMGKEIVLIIRNELIAKKKIDTGKLKNSIRYQVVKEGQNWSLRIIDLSGYLNYVDEGRKPHPNDKKKWPPRKPIEQWVRRKIPTKDPEGVSFAIVRKIGEKGIAPTHVIKKAVEKTMAKWRKKLGELLTQEIKQNLLNDIKNIFK